MNVSRRVIQIACRSRGLMRVLKHPQMRYYIARRFPYRTVVGTLIFIPTTFLIGNYSFLHTMKWVAKKSKTREEYVQRSKRISQLVVNGIIAINGIIFLLWQNPRFIPMCERYFLLKHNSRRFFPLVGSMFSHYYHVHILFNMIAFHSFSRVLASGMGAEPFLWYYLSAGAFSGMVSKIGHVLRRSSGASLGASGAVIGLLFLYSRCFPQSRVQLIFLPGITFNIKSAVNGLILFDCAGLLFGWRKIDHFAHLGGVLFGYLYWTFFRKSWFTCQQKLRNKMIKAR